MYGYVYKYINLETCQVDYVGLVNVGNSLKRRIQQHKKDYWYKEDLYKICFIPCESKTDCEYLEAAFISYYGSDKRFNVAKKGWGSSGLVDIGKLQWYPYEKLAALEAQNYENDNKKRREFENKKRTLERTEYMMTYNAWKEGKNEQAEILAAKEEEAQSLFNKYTDDFNKAITKGKKKLAEKLLDICRYYSWLASHLGRLRIEVITNEFNERHKLNDIIRNFRSN